MRKEYFRLPPLAIALALVSHCAAIPAWAEYWVGVVAYRRGDYAAAICEWQRLVEEGHAQAEVSLGWMYVQGQGISQDYAAARELFGRAAAQGQAVAQYNLAQLYQGGLGGPQDYDRARYWFEESARQGNA